MSRGRDGPCRESRRVRPRRSCRWRVAAHRCRPPAGSDARAGPPFTQDQSEEVGCDQICYQPRREPIEPRRRTEVGPLIHGYRRRSSCQIAEVAPYEVGVDAGSPPGFNRHGEKASGPSGAPGQGRMHATDVSRLFSPPPAVRAWIATRERRCRTLKGRRSKGGPAHPAHGCSSRGATWF